MKSLWMLKELHGRNFLSYSKFDWKVSPGVTYILGENLSETSTFTQKNGVGKSALLDALVWVLFNRLLRGAATVDQVVRRESKRGCRVGVVLENLSLSASLGTLTLLRCRKDAEYGNKLLVQWGTGPLEPQDTEWIERTLGTSYPAFLLANVFGGDLLKKFASSTETQQIKIIETLMHISWLDDAREKSKEDLYKTSGRLGGLKEEFLKLESEKKSLESRISDTQTDFTALSKERVERLSFWHKEKETLLAEKTVFLGHLETAKTAVEEKNKEILRFTQDLDRMEDILRPFQSPSNPVLKRGLPCPLCRQLVLSLPGPELPYEMTAYKENAEQLKIRLGKLSAELPYLHLEVQNIQQKIGKLEGGLEASQREILHLENTSLADSLKNRLESLKKNLQNSSLQREGIASEISDVTEEISEIEILNKAFAAKGLKRLAVQRFRDQFVELVNQEIAALTDGTYRLLLKSDAEESSAVPWIVTEGFEVPYSLFSGGEKARIDIGIFLGAYKFGRLFSYSGLSFLILDDVLGMLDFPGVARVLDRLKFAQSESVLVAGLTEGLEDYADQVLFVQKKNGVSEVKAA